MFHRHPRTRFRTVTIISLRSTRFRTNYHSTAKTSRCCHDIGIRKHTPNRMSLPSSVITRRILSIYHATNPWLFFFLPISPTTNAAKVFRISTSNQRNMAVHQRTTKYCWPFHHSNSTFQLLTPPKHLGRSGGSPLSEGVLLWTLCWVLFSFLLSFPFLFFSFLILSFPISSNIYVYNNPWGAPHLSHDFSIFNHIPEFILNSSIPLFIYQKAVTCTLN